MTMNTRPGDLRSLPQEAIRQASGTSGRTTFALIIAGLILYGILFFAYDLVIVSVFGDEGYRYSPNMVKVVESLALTTVSAAMLPARFSKPSDLFVAIFFVVPVVPTFVYFALADESRIFTYYSFVGYAIIVNVAKARLPVAPFLRRGTEIATGIAGALVAITFGAIVFSGALSSINLSFSNVYETRAAISEGFLGSGIGGYLTAWGPSVGTMTLLLLGLWQRRIAFVFVALAAQFIFYATLNQKSYAFLPFLVLGLFILAGRKNSIFYVVLVPAAIIAMGLFSYFVFHDYWVTSLITRRVFFLITFINFQYYYVFRDLGHVHMATGLLQNLLNYPFPMAPPNLVSWYVWGHPFTNANTGFLGTGYMHFGVMGMVVFATITGLLLSIGNNIAAAARMNKGIAAAFLFAPFFALLTSADLLTSLLTHGLVLSLLMLWLIGGQAYRSAAPSDGATPKA